MPRTRPFGLMPEDERTFGINPMEIDPDVMEWLAMEQERISKEVMGDAYYTEGRPPGEPPGTRTLGTPGSDMYVKYTPPQEEEMPKLYKGQPPGEQPPEGQPPGEQPPGEQPDPETMRAKFAKKVIELIGFNPIGYDPYREATIEYNTLAEERPVVAKNVRGRTGRGDLEISGGPPAFTTLLQKHTSKKQSAMEAMKFSFDQFDKDMGWTTIPQGGMAFQEGTGKTIVGPGKTKLLSPEEEAQKVRIRAAGRPPKLLTPQEEAQKVRISAAGRPPEKLEYTPKQALSRISAIDATIARMKSIGTVDTAMVIQNPNLAALIDTKDPEAIRRAIQSLETERDYVAKFVPKGTEKTLIETKKKYKTADEVRAAYRDKKITKEDAVNILRKDFGMK